MHRIDGVGATIDNLFTEGNPGTGTPATQVTADFMNAVQEEIAHVIEEAELELDKEDNTQLHAAILALIAAGGAASVPDASTTVKGKVELATDAECITGTDAVRAVTPAALTASAIMKTGGTLSGALNGPAFNTTSSRRYKTDIEHMPPNVALDLLRQVRVVAYKLKVGGLRKVGVIAEELAEGPLEFCVVRSANGDPEAVDYQPLFSIAMSALQGLAERVQKLEFATRGKG